MPARDRSPIDERARRDVWQPTTASISEMVGAARAVAMTGEPRSGTMRGASGDVVQQRSIEGACYTADPNGHAVEVTIDGVLVLARWRDAAARMVHLARNGCRRLIDRHYRLTHLMQPGNIWVARHQGEASATAMVMIEQVEGVRVRLRRVVSGKKGTARLERFDGRERGYQPASEELVELALELIQRQGPPKP